VSIFFFVQIIGRQTAIPSYVPIYTQRQVVCVWFITLCIYHMIWWREKVRGRRRNGGCHPRDGAQWFTECPSRLLARINRHKSHSRFGLNIVRVFCGIYFSALEFFFHLFIFFFFAEPLAQNVTVDADAPFEDEQLVGGAVDPPWDSPDTSKCF